jgi:glutathione-regulated potassium-efflux system protein KefB
MILLAVTAISTSLSRWLGLGSVLAMLAAGIALGPFGFQIARDVERLRNFAELGVVLLMFAIGLEMRPGKLWAMRRLVFGLGILQLFGTATLIAAFIFLRGSNLALSILGGFGLALSSTAVGMKLMKERVESGTRYGQAAFAILLLQDLAIVPLLALIPLLAGTSATHPISAGLRLVQVVCVLAGLIVVGRWILPQALRFQQRFNNSRGFGALVFLAIVGAAVAAEWAGLSMALGAFLTGMMLSGSEYQARIDKIVRPLRRVLLDLFFIAVGMSVDLRLLAERGLETIIVVLVIVSLKALAVYLLGRSFRLGHVGALRMAALLSQAGEFGFVLFGAAIAAGVADKYVFDIAVLVIALSMALTPLLLRLVDLSPARSATSA